MKARRRLATAVGGLIVSESFKNRERNAHTSYGDAYSWDRHQRDQRSGRNKREEATTMTGGAFNLLDQLTFYGSYHNNKWNQIIHFWFVPLIWWSAVVWGTYTGPLLNSPIRLGDPWSELLVPNLGAFVLVFYTLYYISLDAVAGSTWGVFVGFPLWMGANAMYAFVDYAWLWALGAHVLSWYVQIHPGHAVLEKRAPALLDSFFQSLVLAPLFVWFELLFLFGYRPVLRSELTKRVEQRIAEYRAKKTEADQKKGY